MLTYVVFLTNIPIYCKLISFAHYAHHAYHALVLVSLCQLCARNALLHGGSACKAIPAQARSREDAAGIAYGRVGLHADVSGVHGGGVSIQGLRAAEGIDATLSSGRVGFQQSKLA